MYVRICMCVCAKFWLQVKSDRAQKLLSKFFSFLLKFLLFFLLFIFYYEHEHFLAARHLIWTLFVSSETSKETMKEIAKTFHKPFTLAAKCFDTRLHTYHWAYMGMDEKHTLVCMVCAEECKCVLHMILRVSVQFHKHTYKYF